MFAAVERLIQRQAEIAQRDGVLRALERVGRSRVLGGRVAIRAGSARGVDRALR